MTSVLKKFTALFSFATMATMSLQTSAEETRPKREEILDVTFERNSALAPNVYMGEIDLSYRQESGKNNSKDFDGKAKFEAEWKRVRLKSKFFVTFHENNGNTTANRYGTEDQVDVKLIMDESENDLFSYLYLKSKHDEVGALQDLTIANLGLGKNFGTEKVRFRVQAGPGLAAYQLQGEDSEAQSGLIFMASASMKAKLTESIRATASVNYIKGKTFDVVSAEAALEFRINKWLSTFVGAEIDYVPDAPADFEEVETKLMMGLKGRFGNGD